MYATQMQNQLNNEFKAEAAHENDNLFCARAEHLLRLPILLFENAHEKIGNFIK